MFRTMDGVEVYDKHDVDGITEPIQQNAVVARQTAERLETSKLDKSEANSKFAEDRARLDTLESDKATKTEMNSNFAEDRARLDTLESDKATKTEMNSNFAEDRTRLDALETSKASRTEIPEIVNDTVNGIINSKLALIENDIVHIVQNEVSQIPNPGVATAAEINEIVNQHF